MAFFVPSLVFAQIQGLYCTNGHGSTCIEFLENQSFKYRTGCCLGSKLGRGEFKISDKQLSLDFQGNPGDTIATLVKIDTLDFDPSEAKIILRVFDFQRNTPLTHVSFSVQDPYGKTIQGSSDNEGNGYISIEHFKKPMILRVSQVGYDDVEILLNDFQTYGVKVHMRPWTMGFHHGYTHTYSIRHLRNGKSIRLKMNNKHAKFIRYDYREPLNQ